VASFVLNQSGNVANGPGCAKKLMHRKNAENTILQLGIEQHANRTFRFSGCRINQNTYTRTAGHGVFTQPRLIPDFEVISARLFDEGRKLLAGDRIVAKAT